MENDSIRTAGEMTLVDVWIEGKLRSISVAREAIARLRQVPPDRALSDEECREFVRTRLALVAATAKDRLRATDPSAEAVTISAELVEAGEEGSVAERRKTDRRKRERRAPGQPGGRIGDRRQGDRRKADRRKTSRKPPEKTN